jgi:hypothetical protein
MDGDAAMFKTKLCAALIGATALVPLAADSHAERNASEFVATQGFAIASQGNQALRDIRREARLCLRSQKPAPLDAFLREVHRQVTPTEVVQSL